jgi:hypothetical protein
MREKVVLSIFHVFQGSKANAYIVRAANGSLLLIGAPQPTVETIAEIKSLGVVSTVFFFDYMHETWAEDFAKTIAKEQEGKRPRIVTPEWAREGLELQIVVDR